MGQAYLTANSYLGLIKEASGASGTIPSTGNVYYIPVSTPQITPTQVFLRDEALRGSPTAIYDHVQGVRHDLVEFRSYLYADTFPVLIQSILGGADTVSGSSPYTHQFSLLNNPATGSQPPTYSILDFDGANFFTTTYSVADSLMLSFGAEVAAEATAKFMTWPYTSYASGSTLPTKFATSSYSISSEHLIPSWDALVSINGTAYTSVASGELTFNRKTAPIFTLGTQSAFAMFAGPLEVTGKFTLVVSSTSDAFSTGSSAYALTRSPEPVVITLTDPNDSSGGTQHSIAFTMSKVQFHDVKRLRGKDYTEVEVSFTANANATDGGSSTAYAPISATVINGNSGAY